ncbi:hypothetical protein QE152_g10604 [Popillia japonica]|uniref:Uncharacterized protein n=1 Tax=Popillia japonica TaxID=7064 RepID=A0AAW1LVR1_POPJA
MVISRTPIVLCCLALSVGFAYGAPQKPEVEIISQTNDVNPDGGYKWSYEASNSIKAEETGTLKKTNDPENPEVIVAQADDEGGFQPQGAHIPTPPPIPPLIQRGLDYIAANPSKDSQ